METIRLIVNPYSGTGQAEAYAYKLKEVLERTYCADVEIVMIDEDHSAYSLAHSDEGHEFDTVISLGGDGTVNQVISGILDSPRKVKFGFVPLGTVNDLGRALGMSMNPETVIQQFTNVSERKIDIGRINDQYFINVVAIGSIPESVMETSHEDKNKFGWLAYFKDSLKAALSGKSYNFKLSFPDQQIEEINSNLILISLTNSVGGFEQMNQQAAVDDGKLYLSAVLGNNIFDMSSALIEGKLLDRETEKLYSFESQKVTIELTDSESLTCNVDGDPGMTLPVTLEVLPQVLTCLIPAPKV